MYDHAGDLNQLPVTLATVPVLDEMVETFALRSDNFGPYQTLEKPWEK